MLVRNSIEAYSGLYGFHKYWGKKPAEIFRFLIEKLSQPGDLIIDPFVGSGVLARESNERGRNFIGVDINPVAVQICRLMVTPPKSVALRSALDSMSKTIKGQIMGSYSIENRGGFATHYLWENETIKSVWTKHGGRARVELEPTQSDYDLFSSYEGYESTNIRPIRLFDNSRINTKSTLTISDLLTGRALRNVDLILDEIKKHDEVVRVALMSCVTSSIGQMTKMVFAITGRGKTTGKVSTKIEVGSWVIGYWRPELHFEINVWNCFERRLKKLIDAVEAQESLFDLPERTENGFSAPYSKIELGDARTILKTLQSDSASLIITDPPHSDRIPYLELSELWNAVLNFKSSFEEEIVVSNAKQRFKGLTEYQHGISEVIYECSRVLKSGGHLVVLFNARDDASWAPLKISLENAHTVSLSYCGAFESHYSVGSVVQDNREGGLQHDFGLIFKKKGQIMGEDSTVSALSQLPGWTTDWPSVNKSADATLTD